MDWNQAFNTMTRNPHFDDELFVWNDQYSGRYGSVPYPAQFDDQWRMFLERRPGFKDHTGVETSDAYIDDRIYELTGVRGVLERRRYGFGYPIVQFYRRLMGADARRGVGGKLYLEPHFPLDFFEDKRCLDVGCGAGRWTRTLQALGAKVKSIDVSEHALQSTRRFNADSERLDIFDLADRQDLHGVFDLTLCWGVVMCTHDPKGAFEHVAATVKPGGHLYVMVYAPTYHASEPVREMRRQFHRECKTIEDKIEFVFKVAEDPNNAINYMDMLNTFYNWTIREETVHEWFRRSGFTNTVTLNKKEPNNCAWHVLGQKS
jgi:2-polyprenyl-3-methyl-5-hydroxy-6-metoxy-1,4-benzoquinol methylase